MKNNLIFILLYLTLSFASTDDAIDISKVWEFQTGSSNRGEILIDDELIYFGSSDQYIYCLSKLDGKLVWKFKTNGDNSSGGVVSGTNLIIGSFDGFIYCLNKLTGQLIWKYETGQKITANPLFYQSHGVELILLGSYDSKFYGLDFKSGLKKWEFQSGDRINGSGVLYGSQVIFGGCDEILYQLEATSGVLANSIEINSYMATTPAIQEDNIYISHYDNAIIKIDLKSKKQLWQFQTEDPFFSDPFVHESICFAGCRDKKMYAIDTSSGKQLWSYKTKGQIDHPPVVYKDLILFGSTDGRIYVLNKKGEEIKKILTGAPVDCRLSIEENSLYFASVNSKVYKYEIKR